MDSVQPSREGLSNRFAQLAVLFGHLAVEMRNQPEGSELLPVLSALADVEEEQTDELMAAVVSRMRTDDVIWEKLAEAVGVSTTVAWRRWHNTDPAAPRATGQVRPRRSSESRERGHDIGDIGLL